jgi:hypothetical protein
MGSEWPESSLGTSSGLGTSFGSSLGSSSLGSSTLFGGAAQERAAQSDLRNGLTAEKTTYTDNQEYDPSPTSMREIEPSLGWGGKLKVVVGDAVDSSDHQTVCLSETSASGRTFELADVAAGANAGTFYGTSAAGCPSNDGSGANLRALGSSW